MANLNSNAFERLDKKNAVLLIVDHQVGLFQLVRDQSPEEYRANVLAHAALGKAFDLPTILTSSAENGPNGPLPKEILEMYPDAPFIKRNGEVNAWDNADFRKAVEATGKKQIIIAGIVTDVCTAFLAMSLRQEGYSVFANAEASGCSSRRVADDANARMRSVGVHVLSTFAVVCELMRDWRNTPGSPQLMPWFDKHYPAYGYLARGHLAAIKSGVVQPGEDE
ncbi:hypothetical protein D9756_009489 [Leucocoprinus leucothites]|uniref:Isochorismatase-like domain-containing protein n=1 Tax=Leucocoprinus leucothites TaxID=201217 RepID=A0A8H5CXJ7_9AGAR|nr:hypothetical protein D9756_009489 [Leucoagaricus leucothites]